MECKTIKAGRKRITLILIICSILSACMRDIVHADGSGETVVKAEVIADEASESDIEPDADDSKYSDSTEQKTESGKSARTGDSNHIGQFIWMILLSAVIMLYLVKRTFAIHSATCS